MAENPEYYKDFKPLTENDASSIKTEIERLLGTPKYADSAWGL